MPRKSLRTACLGGASFIALTVGLAQAAGAQDKPGFYLGLQGEILLSGGTSFDAPFGQLTSGLMKDLSVPPGGDGAGAKITAGYQFHGPWSIEANLAGNWLESTSDETFAQNPQGPEFIGAKLSSRTEYYLADFDAGYTIQLGQGRDIRLTGGVQYGNFRVDRNLNMFAYNYIPFPGAGGVDIGMNSRFWGIGPKLGVDGHYQLGRSDFSVVGGVSGSVLFGRLTNSNSYYSYGNGPSGGGGNSDSKGHTAYGLNANLGLAYQMPYANFDSSITVGMQVDQWWNIAEQQEFTGNGTQNVNLTTWGPFLKWETHF
ncbi:MAG: hypothetical protein QOK29_70 [Rhodospirillaceae bacterium]|jgi:hypothetical protein|nr:hypothetical protein [Rhodospirillaceae bacterium]